MVLPGEGWALPGVLYQDTLHIHEYIYGFPPKYVKKVGQLPSCTATLRPYPVMGLMAVMMT